MKEILPQQNYTLQLGASAPQRLKYFSLITFSLVAFQRQTKNSHLSKSINHTHTHTQRDSGYPLGGGMYEGWRGIYPESQGYYKFRVL
jgi:hypothetical protein